MSNTQHINATDHSAQKERFARSFANGPGQRRILISCVVSVVIVLELAHRGDVWLLACIAIFFVALFTFERMLYVATIQQQKQELKRLQGTPYTSESANYGDIGRENE